MKKSVFAYANKKGTDQPTIPMEECPFTVNGSVAYNVFITYSLVNDIVPQYFEDIGQLSPPVRLLGRTLPL